MSARVRIPWKEIVIKILTLGYDRANYIYLFKCKFMFHLKEDSLENQLTQGGDVAQW